MIRCSGFVLPWVLVCILGFVEEIYSGWEAEKEMEGKKGWGSRLSKGVWGKIKLTQGIFRGNCAVGDSL